MRPLYLGYRDTCSYTLIAGEGLDLTSLSCLRETPESRLDWVLVQEPIQLPCRVHKGEGPPVQCIAGCSVALSHQAGTARILINGLIGVPLTYENAVIPSTKSRVLTALHYA